MAEYNVTDREVLHEVQLWLIEEGNNGASLPESSPWDIEELQQYLNDRQRRLLRETLMVSKRDVVGGLAGQTTYELPEDWIATKRAAWQDELGTIRELHQTDSWALDRGLPEWDRKRATRPLLYAETDVPPDTFQVGPAPRNVGVVHLLYTAVEATLGNTGVKLAVPDEFAPYLKWGVLADCLRKEGPGQDLPRATYCEERFDEGIALGRLILDELARGAQ